MGNTFRKVVELKPKVILCETCSNPIGQRGDSPAIRTEIGHKHSECKRNRRRATIIRMPGRV